MPESGEARALIDQLYRAALVAADPRRAVRDSLCWRPGELLICDRLFPVSGQIRVVAIGKAAVTMALGAEDALGDAISGGIAITKDGHTGAARLDRIEIAEAAHPIPDERGVAASRRALELVRAAGADDLVLALISGGGSALFEAPQAPVTLIEMARVTDLMLRAGADITELNQVRTPLSQVKGGGLLAKAGTTPVVTLILSDVLGNDPRVIASGPTVPGARDPIQARQVLERYALWDRVPGSIRTLLVTNATQTDPDGPTSPLFVISDTSIAVGAAARQATQAGLAAQIIWHEATGEARVRANDWVDACLEAPDEIDCLLGGGEMTVTVNGNGVGGRNTEFALAAAVRLHELGRYDWVIASLATDGQDGPTGVAGAVLDASDIDRLRTLGIEPEAAIADNDTLTPVHAIGADVSPGPTGTNVNDLYIALRRR